LEKALDFGLALCYNILVSKRNGVTAMNTTAERVLLHKDGTPAAVGDKVTSFRGNEYELTGWPHNGHNRVWVKAIKDADGNQLSYTAEYFPTVFDLKWAD
jgi:hypothetical protein